MTKNLLTKAGRTLPGSELMTQRFHKGDWVRIAKDLGPSMRHFTADCEAIVMGSYNDKYGGGNVRDYTLHLKGRGQVSWYSEHQLTLIETGRLDLLDEWEKEREAEHKQKSNLDWIFAHGPEVLMHPHGASLSALGNCVGIDNLWGTRGEGITYYTNALTIMELARPFLESGDKEGWLSFCKRANP